MNIVEFRILFMKAVIIRMSLLFQLVVVLLALGYMLMVGLFPELFRSLLGLIGLADPTAGQLRRLADLLERVSLGLLIGVLVWFGWIPNLHLPPVTVAILTVVVALGLLGVSLAVERELETHE